MRPIVPSAAALVFILLAIECSVIPAWGQQTDSFFIEGTAKDAAGKPISKGVVQVSLAGGKTLTEEIKDGNYKVKVDLPAKKTLPLTIKLTFFSHDKNYVPPRWIEHLSPRIPKGEGHKIHVVMYTDDQLRKANLGELYCEAQQLETSLFFWMQATEDFKQAHKSDFSFKRLDDRRKLIVALWSEAGVRSPLPEAVVADLRTHFAEKSVLSANMKRFLPED